MIDLKVEKTFPVVEAQVPNCTRQFAPETWTRWATKGLNGVVLESKEIGGVKCTSIDAICRFFDAVTANKKPSPGRVEGAKIATEKLREIREDRAKRAAAVNARMKAQGRG
jgi:hypothetical protein